MHVCVIERDHGATNIGRKSEKELCECQRVKIPRSPHGGCLHTHMCVCVYCVIAGQLWLCWGSMSHSAALLIPSGEEHHSSVLNPLVLWPSGWSAHMKIWGGKLQWAHNYLRGKKVKPRHLAMPSELQVATRSELDDKWWYFSAQYLDN